MKKYCKDCRGEGCVPVGGGLVEGCRLCFETGIEQRTGGWWCPQCERFLNWREVSYDDHHRGAWRFGDHSSGCGALVEYKHTPKHVPSPVIAPALR